MEYVIGIDLGGTRIKAGAVSRGGKLLVWREADTEAGQGPAGIIERIGLLVEDVRRHPEVFRDRVRALGVGSPGPLDSRRGVVYFAPNLPGWRDVPLARWLERKTGLPTLVENDANVAAWGEWWLGAGRGARSLVLVTLGTGIGGGIVLEGKIFSGRDGAAGEIGHLTLLPGGRQCSCGKRGCLEAYCGAEGIVAEYRRRKPNGRLRDGRDVREICQAAAKGDQAARGALRATGEALGLGLSQVVQLLNPERIVLGGGILPAWRWFFPALRHSLRRNTLSVPLRGLRLCRVKLGNQAGVIGAAGCAWKQFETSAS